MREHDAADHVADRPHAVGRRAKVVVDHDATALQLDASLLRIQTLRVGHASDREQDLVRVDRAALTAGREPHLQRAVALHDLRDLAVGVDLTAELGQVLRVDGDQVRVDHGQHLGQHLEHGDLAAECGEHGGKLHADDAAADDRQPSRDLFQLEDLVRIDGELGAWQRDARDRRACRDDDVLGLELVAGQVDDAVAGQASVCPQRGDPACLEQPFDSFDELVDDGGLALLRGRPVEAHLVGDDAERSPVPGLGVQLGGLEQSLGRDAAAHEAGPAHAVLLDDGGLGAKLGRAQSGDIAPGPTADDDQVKRPAHSSLLYQRSKKIMPLGAPASPPGHRSDCTG